MSFPKRATVQAMFCYCLLKAGGDPVAAAHIAESEFGYESRIGAAIRKAGIASSAEDFLGDPSVQHLYSTFVESLTGISIFDSMMPSMTVVPMYQRLLIASLAGPAAAGVVEGELMPVGKLSVEGAGLQPRTVAGILACSREALVGGDVSNLRNELVKAVAAATDAVFLEYLAGFSEVVPSSGTDADAVRQDLAAGLELLNLHAGSAVHLVVDPTAAKRLSTMNLNNLGADLAPGGGQLAGIRVMPSDHLPQISSDAGTALLIDGSQILAADAGLLFDASGEALLSSGGEVLSLFQSGGTALRFRRHVGFEIARQGAVACLTGVNWGAPTVG